MNVPALRFPDFHDDYKITKLGDVANFAKGKGISKADIADEGATPCIRYGELYTVYGTSIETVLSATNVPVDDLKLSIGGEVIVPASGEDAKDIATASVVLRSGVALGGDLNIIRGGFDGLFLASYISGKRRLALAAMAQGNSVVHLYPSQLATLELSLPSITEQKKIAAFLAVVDAKIAALRDRVAGLERSKRGLMQALFSQTFRFTQDNGTAFPDWEEKRLGDLVDQSNRYGFTGGPFGSDLKQSHYTEEGVMVIQLQNIGDGEFIEKPDRIIFTSEEDADRLRACNILAGDLLISKMGDPVARVCKVPDTYQRYVMCSDGIRFVVDEKRFNKEFVFQALNTSFFRKNAIEASIGSTRRRISLGDLKGLKLPIPHPDEQAKIAGALSAMDAKIAAVTGQLDRMQDFKKGLLQQMFV